MAAAVLRVPHLLPAALIIAIAAPVGLLAGYNPPLAVVAALGVGFVLIAFVDLAAGIALLFVVTFLEQVPLAGPVLSFTKIAGALVALAWIARIASDRDAGARTLFASHPLASYLLIAFVGWIAISIGWAGERGEALAELARYALVAILYVIVFTAVRTERDASWIVGGFLAGAGLSAAYGIVFRPAPEAGDPVVRLTSTVEDPNVLAAFLVTGIILASAILLAWRGSAGVRLAAGITGIVMLVAFLLTGSRGGLIAATAGIVAALFLAGRWRPHVAALAAIGIAATFVYYTAVAPPEIRERLVAATAGEREALTARPTIWMIGWRMAKDNPVAGVGAGNFEESTVRYLLEPGGIVRSDVIVDRPRVAHNTYLHVLAELGIVGLALFLAVIAFSLGCMAAAARRFAAAGNPRMELLSRAFAIATVSFLVAAFFISEQVSKQLWLLIALGPSLLSLSIRVPGSGAAHDASPPGPGRSSLHPR